jgi:inositol-phosphate phosphatase/L-galactose 1-phosphate phosphatase/histidinol-phosphatase
LSSQCQRVIYGGDCYNYAMLAMGHIDLVIEQGLKIYDYMAVATLVESAGGYCCDFAGEKIVARSNGSLIAAATRELAMAALEYMRA